MSKQPVAVTKMPAMTTTSLSCATLGFPSSAATVDPHALSTREDSVKPHVEKQSHWWWAWVAFLPVALLRAGTLAETDTFWQVRTGLLTLSAGRLPIVDTLSWTAHGKPWTLNSWGFNVLLAYAYRLDGLAAVAVLGSTLVMLVAAIVLVAARRAGATPFAAGAVLLLMSPALIAWFSVRPQLVDYVVVPALLLLLRPALQGPRRVAALIGMAVVSLVWVNFHAAAALGVAMAGAAGVASLVGRRLTMRSIAGGLAPAGACLLGSLLNPLGAGLWQQSRNVRSSSVAVVTEWQPIDLTDPMELLMLLVVVAAVVIAVKRKDWSEAGALVALAFAAGFAIRFLPVADLASIPVLASALSSDRLRTYAAGRRILFRGGALALVSTLALVAAPNFFHLGRPDPEVYPAKSIAALPPGCHLFNDYRIGGLVILERPDIPVSLDSRNDLYGADTVTKAQRILEGRGSVAELEAQGINCVLVPASMGLARQLGQAPGWSRISDAPGAQLFVRSRSAA